MQSQILVPLDGSALSETVLPHAAVLARATRRSLILLRAIAPHEVVGPMGGGAEMVGDVVDQVWDAAFAAAGEYLETVATRVREWEIEVHTKVVDGDAAGAIVWYVQNNPSIKTIAMATHGRSGVGRWIFGSVTEKVLHASPVPLLITRPHGEEPARQVLPEAYRAILVPLDGSPFAEQALDQAEVLASTMGARLVLLSVLPGTDGAGFEESVDAEFLLANHEAAEGRMALYLNDTAARLEATGLKVEPEIGHGDPAEGILRVAEQQDIDLTVMATHGRGGLQALWMGGTALKVVQGAVRPVLLVRAREPGNKGK